MPVAFDAGLLVPQGRLHGLSMALSVPNHHREENPYAQ